MSETSLKKIWIFTQLKIILIIKECNKRVSSLAKFLWLYKDWSVNQEVCLILKCMNSVWNTFRWKGIIYKLIKISLVVLRKSLHSLKWLSYWLSVSLLIEWCSVHFIEKIEMVEEFLYVVPTCVCLPGATVVNPDPAGEYTMWHCTVLRYLLFWDVT